MPRAIRNPNSYNAIHKWLVQDYGHPVACEKCGREGIKSGRRWNIMWALKASYSYMEGSRGLRFWAALPFKAAWIARNS